MSKPARSSDWLRQQAQARQAVTAQLSTRTDEKHVRQQEQAKKVFQKLISQTITQQQRLTRLAAAFADRCYRVHELSGLYRAEWERAQRLQADNEELRRRIAQLESASADDSLPTVS